MSDIRGPREPAGPRSAAVEEARSNTPLIIAIVVLVVLLLIGLALLLTRDRGGDDVAFDQATPPPVEEEPPTPEPPAEEPETEAEPTPTPTPTPEATPTPTPTPTPTEVAVGPGSAAERGEGPPGLQVEGSGATQTEDFDHPGGIVIITYELEEDGRFLVTAVSTDEGEDVVLVDDQEADDDSAGQRAAHLPDGTYRLEIEGTGSWVVTLERPVYARAHGLPMTFEGNVSGVSEPFEATGADVRLELEAVDAGDLEVRILDVDGNEVEAFTTSGGEETVQLEAGQHYLEVRGPGRWRVLLS